MNNKAVYEKRIVAFMDILGFSTMVEDSKVDTTMRRKIKKATEIVRESFRPSDEDRKVTTFSDSAVVSYKLKSTASLFYLLMDIIHLQLDLGNLGIMIRGGIATGDCYHDGRIIFGPAMNEAYRLESKVAKWPRVVIKASDLALGLVESTDINSNSLRYDIEDIFNCLKKDDYNDERNNKTLYFVDFLRQPQELDEFGDEYFEWLRGFRGSIIDGLNRYSSKSEMNEISLVEKNKVFKKYRWIMKYWNSVVNDEKANYPVPDIDPVLKKQFREKYKSLKITERFPYY